VLASEKVRTSSEWIDHRLHYLTTCCLSEPEYPELDAIDFVYDPTKTLEEQQDECLQQIRAVCFAKIDSAKKMQLDLDKAAEQEREEHRRIAKAAAEETQRQDQARRRRQERQNAEETKQATKRSKPSNGNKARKDRKGKRHATSTATSSTNLYAKNSNSVRFADIPSYQSQFEAVDSTNVEPRELLPSFSQASSGKKKIALELPSAKAQTTTSTSSAPLKKPKSKKSSTDSLSTVPTSNKKHIKAKKTYTKSKDKPWVKSTKHRPPQSKEPEKRRSKGKQSSSEFGKIQSAAAPTTTTDRPYFKTLKNKSSGHRPSKSSKKRSSSSTQTSGISSMERAPKVRRRKKGSTSTGGRRKSRAVTAIGDDYNFL